MRSIVADRYASRYGAAVAGRPGGDPLDVLRTGSRPRVMTPEGGYGYSIDPFGRGGVAIGRSGHLLAAVSGTQIAAGTAPDPSLDRIDEALNDPYEMDPTGKLGGDIPYSFAELEPLLRASDFDLDLLPQRLRGRLVALLEDHPEFARVFTSHSKSDDSLLDPNALGASGYVSLLGRIATAGGSGLTAQQINQLVAPELRLGRKLDINRPFGNGIDDTTSGAGFGVIDEPREIYPGVLLPAIPGDRLPNITAATAPSTAPGNLGGVGTAFVALPGPQEQQTFAVSPGSGQAVPMAYQGVSPRYNILLDRDENEFNPAAPASVYPFDIERTFAVDGTPTPLGRQVTARQLMARHLYVLMMLLTREYTDFPSMATVIDLPEPDPADFDPAFYKARRIAQWAVNVVDYRDNDAIMTRFVFDPDPFDGWNPPAEPAPLENVVWGVESPDLVFTESLALHDVRVRNTDSNELKADPDDPTPNPMHTDENTDQVRKPEGSLFLELYCPAPQVGPVPPVNLADARPNREFLASCITSTQRPVLLSSTWHVPHRRGRVPTTAPPMVPRFGELRSASGMMLCLPKRQQVPVPCDSRSPTAIHSRPITPTNYRRRPIFQTPEALTIRYGWNASFGFVTLQTQTQSSK